VPIYLEVVDLPERRTDRGLMVRSAAAMFVGATLLGFVEGVIPGGTGFSLLPSFAALGLAAAVLVVGPRVPRQSMLVLGPLGAALIAGALASTDGTGDGAVLYLWPVLWVAHFFGRSETILMVAWIGVCHALALAAMPDGAGSVDRWIDVMGSVIVVALVVRYLSELTRALVERLTEEARVDPLTGLLNRRGFDERLRVELARAARDGGWVSVASFDIDHFKQVNDRHGHELGDRVLTWVGEVLRDHARDVDIVARVGGEEFIVFLPGTDLHGAEAFAERVRAAVGARGPAAPRGRYGIAEELHVTVSAGVTAIAGAVDAQALLATADRALYTAKRTGRDRTVRDAAPQALAGARRLAV
jgi:diguanylate cyclase (GGDEF)-like protein